MSKDYYQNLKDPRWQKKRLEIMQRDNFKCLVCGSNENSLTVHHIYYLPKLKPWEYENESMKTICEICHGQLTLDMQKLAGILAWDILAGRIQIP